MSNQIEQLWRTFGAKIRAQREQKNMTQEEAGARAGMRRQQWHRIEQGASTKRSTLLRIAKALDLKEEDVFSWAGFRLEAPDVSAMPVIESPGIDLEEVLLYYFRLIPAARQRDAVAGLVAFYEQVAKIPTRKASLEILGQIRKDSS